MTEEEKQWRRPPPGTVIVTEGTVQEGDWFYISELGAWGPVPRIGWGSSVDVSLIARGKIDLSRVEMMRNEKLCGAPGAARRQPKGQ